MNSFEVFMQSQKPPKARVMYCASGQESNSKMVSDAVCLHLPPMHSWMPWGSGMNAVMAGQRTVTAQASPGDRRLPPLPQAVVCSDHEPQIIRFVDGEDGPTRRRALQTCVNQLGATRGRKLLVRCRQGEHDNQLGYARRWAAELCARWSARPVVVGIDGIDQWLTSPSVAARYLQAILNVGAAVACAVDPRYLDSRLLAFHLRILGIVVVRDPLVPKRFIRVSTGLEMPRLSPEAERGTPARRFPGVRSTALGAYAAESHDRGAPTTWNGAASQQGSKYRRTSEHATPSAISDAERVEYARAYRNSFAINRLLREWIGLQTQDNRDAELLSSSPWRPSRERSRSASIVAPDLKSDRKRTECNDIAPLRLRDGLDR